MCAHAWCVCLFTGFLMPSGSCVNVLPVYYAIRMVNENTTTVVSSQFLNKGYHSACCLFSLCSLLFLSMPPVVDDPNRSQKLKTNALLHKWLTCWETSLVVQWLRLHASTAGGTGSIPGQGTKIPHATQSSQKKKRLTWLCFTKEQNDLGTSSLY